MSLGLAVNVMRARALVSVLRLVLMGVRKWCYRLRVYDAAVFPVRSGDVRLLAVDTSRK